MTTPTMTCPTCWGAAKPCSACKGARTVPDVQLSPSFMLSHFVKSNTAKSKGIPNAPPAQVVARLRELAAALEPLRAAFGDRLSITSGYRCPALNTAIGGNDASAHCQGFAADMVIAGLDATGVMRWLKSNYRLPWDQAIDEPGWFHLGVRSPDGKRQRKQMLVMRGGKYSVFAG